MCLSGTQVRKTATLLINSKLVDFIFSIPSGQEAQVPGKTDHCQGWWGDLLWEHAHLSAHSDSLCLFVLYHGGGIILYLHEFCKHVRIHKWFNYTFIATLVSSLDQNNQERLRAVMLHVTKHSSKGKMIELVDTTKCLQRLIILKY